MRPDGGSDMLGVKGWLPGTLPGLEYTAGLIAACCSSGLEPAPE